MSQFFDTIVAPITGVQKAAVAVIRLSGPESWRIARQLFTPNIVSAQARYAYYGRFAHGDDGLLTLFADGHSFTGEETAEMSIHGSPASVRGLLDCCVERGARLAGPGEFTQRAFMHGRIDLTQAEAIRDVIESETAVQIQAAQRNRAGKLRAEIVEIAEALNSVLTAVEATTDFSEEIGELDAWVQVHRLEKGLAKVEHLLGTAATGEMIRQGALVAILGRPNAGKSSLLNAILRSDRAIVTPIPGTTRDVLETFVELNGFPVRLFDTAGVRATADEIEAEGVRRAREVAAKADLVLYVYAADEGWQDEDSAEIAALNSGSANEGDSAPTSRVIVLANKADLADAERGVPISALTGDGLAELFNQISDHLCELSASPVINARHQIELQTAAESIQLAMETLNSAMPTDLASVHLQTGIAALGRVIGESVSADILERIFRDFCIGK